MAARALQRSFCTQMHSIRHIDSDSCLSTAGLSPGFSNPPSHSTYKIRLLCSVCACQVCACHVCVYVCLCMQRREVRFRCLPQSRVTCGCYSILPTLELIVWLDGLASKPWDIICTPSQVYIGAPGFFFLGGGAGLNLCPHVCRGGTLLTGLSPCPPPTKAPFCYVA